MGDGHEKCSKRRADQRVNIKGVFYIQIPCLQGATPRANQQYDLLVFPGQFVMVSWGAKYKVDYPVEVSVFVDGAAASIFISCDRYVIVSVSHAVHVWRYGFLATCSEHKPVRALFCRSFDASLTLPTATCALRHGNTIGEEMSLQLKTVLRLCLVLRT